MPLTDKASNKSLAIKIVTINRPISIETNRIDSATDTSRGSQSIAQFGHRHLVRDGHSKTAEISLRLQGPDHCCEIRWRYRNWNHHMIERPLGKQLVKHHWRTNMVSRMRNHPKNFS